MKIRSDKGFTLIELSIVLVIIGLIVGGVLVGQELIRSAELRSVVTQVEQYRTAMATFRDKYGGVPGDLRNAYSFWGAPCGSNTLNNTSTDTGCNGDGDRFVNNGTPYEGRKFWQHLSLAGLMAGDYDSQPGSAVLGRTVPPTKIDNGAFFISYITSDWGGRPTTNTFGITAFPLGGGILSGIDSYTLDNKFDDGRPISGKIGVQPMTTNCTSDNTAPYDPNSTYILTTTQRECVLFFTFY